MASKSHIAREVKRAKLVAKYAEKRAQLKKEGNWLELDALPKNSAKDRLHNRCQITGRPKGYVRMFGICRNVFRELASYGKLPGVTKASW
jgi:small subunit ribosomal protein S14